ncbi:hypothetical protein PLEOSDRAFT_1093564, partial [Pleurotus ostreatus PC15]
FHPFFTERPITFLPNPSSLLAVPLASISLQLYHIAKHNLQCALQSPSTSTQTTQTLRISSLRRRESCALQSAL